MIDCDDRHSPNLRECARYDSACLQRSAHTGSLRVRHGSQILRRALCLRQGSVYERQHPFLVVLRGLTRQEALPWRCNVSVTRVGEKFALLVHDANSDLIGAAFDAEHKHGLRLH